MGALWATLVYKKTQIRKEKEICNIYQLAFCPLSIILLLFFAQFALNFCPHITSYLYVMASGLIKGKYFIFLVPVYDFTAVIT